MTSLPSRKTSARKPSHFGSKIHSPAVGSSLTRFASIGRIGGLTGSCIVRVIVFDTDYTDSWSRGSFWADRFRGLLVAPSPRPRSRCAQQHIFRRAKHCSSLIATDHWKLIEKSLHSLIVLQKLEEQLDWNRSPHENRAAAHFSRVVFDRIFKLHDSKKLYSFVHFVPFCGIFSRDVERL